MQRKIAVDCKLFLIVMLIKPQLTQVFRYKMMDG